MGITIKDIAKAAGVSYSTVSKALNDSPLVKKETKQKILRVADEMGYQPNIAAKKLVSNESRTIGVVWPTVERVALTTLAAKINAALEQQKYHMLLSINPTKTAVDLFNRFQVDGVLVFGEEAHEEIISSSIPLLYYGEPGPATYPTIDVNRRKAIQLGVRHLVQLGHSRIAYIGDLNPQHSNQREKATGYTLGMEEAGYSHLHEAVDSRGLSWQAGYQAVKQLLSKKKPTALISASYDLTVGIIRGIKELHLTIPQDISLVSYDHIPEMEKLDVPVTAVGTPVQTIATEITNHLLQLASGKKVPPAILDVELFQRQSSRSPE
ncbi:substrate-binding domain-containing protein [Kroppenstedtia eburnea]|uniref:Transcriptional regulator, LacI family n=2 Tax=Kroppenstedtia eburnea TaxID=714067 RepID=A0A1N7IYM1_9BACL|nr:LacI family transcriptional regulator [Kroppenstedtia eburnea]SIS42208.1 transcriptional regulator, LacI family [Kroppenstedtia eburnea]